VVVNYQQETMLSVFVSCPVEAELVLIRSPSRIRSATR